jgi:ABC-type glycerol-3-phosphate transport system permease component
MIASLQTVRGKLGLRRRSRLNRQDAFVRMLYVLLTLLSAFMLLPIVYIFNHAFKPYTELFLYPPRIFVRNPTLHNFYELYTISAESLVPVTRYLFNSILVTGVSVVLVCAISTLCAYALSKHPFPGRRALFTVIIVSLMFVPETIEIPRYVVIANLGLINTYWGHILPQIAAPVGVFLMKQFMDQIPGELLEAAKIDGAKEWTILARIAVPLVMPALVTIFIIQFQQSWINPSTSALYMTDDAMKTFPFYMSTLTNTAANSVARQGAAAAAFLVLFVPSLVIFLFFQSKVISTMAHSGIK